jgi:hypothetical protein
MVTVLVPGGYPVPPLTRVTVAMLPFETVKVHDPGMVYEVEVK